MTSSLTLSSVVVADYAAVFVPGGHAPMWDLAVDATSLTLIRDFYEAGKPVSFVCHGPAALVNVKLTDGSFLVAGKKVCIVSNYLKVTCISNSEEGGLKDVMPFLLEDQFVKNGGLYEKGPDSQPFVVVDGLIITGQNVASSHLVGEKLVALLG